MIAKLLTEHHLQLLSLKGRCTGSSESSLVKMPHCLKSHELAHLVVLKPRGLANYFIYLSIITEKTTDRFIKPIESQQSVLWNFSRMADCIY